jgi:hypothetical protein
MTDGASPDADVSVDDPLDEAAERLKHEGVDGLIVELVHDLRSLSARSSPL